MQFENNFIAKFQVECWEKTYYIGSFDSYQDSSKELIMKAKDVDSIKTDEILKGMPTTYRASIVNESGKYLGFIAVNNVNAQKQTAGLLFYLNGSLDYSDIQIIYNVYNNWLKECINIKYIMEIDSNFMHNYFKDLVISRNVNLNTYVPNKLLEPGILPETLEYFSSQYSIPRMQYPFSLKLDGRVIGIVALSSLIWSNRRTDLNIFLDKNLRKIYVEAIIKTL